jgi:hypothetical protein
LNPFLITFVTDFLIFFLQFEFTAESLRRAGRCGRIGRRGRTPT